jgi:hypothetical protein
MLICRIRFLLDKDMVYFLGGPTCGYSPASGRGTKNLLSTTTGEQDQELVQKSAVFVRNT